MPSSRLIQPCDADLARDETQLRVAIWCLLNDARSAEPATCTCLHHLIIESWIDPALEPDERHVPKIPELNFVSLREWMAFGDGQDHSVVRELPMCQILVPGSQRGGKPKIQAPGQDRFNLMNGKQMLQHQFHVRLPAAELAKGVHNQTMPGHCRGNADPKRTGPAMSDPLGASFRLVDLM